MNKAKQLIDRLEAQHSLSIEEYEYLIENQSDELAAYAAEKALALRKQVYGTDVYIRGLIEIGNICRNDCYYCGIRRSNPACDRYRLTEAQILGCAREGYALGFRTFVMQGGEDSAFSVDVVCHLVRQIKAEFPDCAVTLSLGEFPREAYQRCSMQARTVICSVTKPPIRHIMKSCIRRRCRLTTACAAFVI